MARANCLDYLDRQGSLSFAQAPFCEVDSLILSLLAYGRFGGILPGPDDPQTLPLAQAVKQLTARPGWDRTGAVMARQIPALIRRLAQCPRFASLPLGAFQSVLNQDTQFAALTVFLPDGTRYLAFRGTDDTLTGWQECFSLSFAAPIPGQKQAEIYLSKAARRPGKLRLGGHSKGGNLAVWAALHAPPPVRARVLRVYSHDGPGFFQDLTGAPAYRALAGRISILVPQASLVGALLCQDRRQKTIRSWGSGIVAQHDPFTWEVTGTHFRRLPRRSYLGRRRAAVLRGWVSSLSLEEREAFTRILFHLLSAGQARTLSGLKHALPASTLAGLQAFARLDKPAQRELLEGLRRLLVSLGTGGAYPHPKEYSHERN